MNLFKIYDISFYDNTNTFVTAVITNSNAVYAHAIYGNDSTGDGTRANPYATITKANTKTGVSYIHAVGIFTENITTLSKILIGETNETYLKGNININNGFINCNISGIMTYLGHFSFFYNCIINNYIVDTTANCASFYNCFINNLTIYTFSYYNIKNIRNITVRNLKIKSADYSNSPYKNLFTDIIVTEKVIISDVIEYSTDLTKYPTLINILIRKTVKWYFGNVEIPITWTGGNLLTDIKNSLITFSNLGSTTPRTYIAGWVNNNLMFPLLNGNPTAYIIDDSIEENKIFNRYSENMSVEDYSLKNYPANPALQHKVNNYMGYFPVTAYADWFTRTIYDVDINTLEVTENEPDMLRFDTTCIFWADANSTQMCNMCESEVKKAPRGQKVGQLFAQINADATSGFWIGKRYPFANVTPINTVTIVPYNSLTEQSTFPKFDVQPNTIPKIWYWISGVKTGQPVLFSDLLGLGVTSLLGAYLNLYEDYAVSGADLDSYSLTTLTTQVALQDIPNIAYFAERIYLHYKD